MSRDKAASRRTAFITGASSGIGAATALALARDGFQIAVAATRRENLAPVLAELEVLGARALPVVFDLRSISSIEQSMSAVIDTFGEVDVLVNNAAGIPFRKASIDVTQADWGGVVQVSVTGTFFMCQRMGRHLIGGGRPGCIINIASTHGIVGFAQVAAYGTSKAAIIHMTKMLAIEWAELVIRVNAVAPGSVETPSRAAVLGDPVRRAAMLARVPLHRFAAAEEVAGAVRYLASPVAAYVTGQTLVLDGGLTAV